MGIGHFRCDPEHFDWKGFQEHMQYSDEELQALMRDPKKVEHVKVICSPAVQDLYLVAEVVESHGCTAGLRPGDHICYKGLTELYPEYCTSWCPQLHNVNWMAAGVRNFIKMGLDGNSLYCAHSGCMDVGPDAGLGRVIYNTLVLTKEELEARYGKR